MLEFFFFFFLICQMQTLISLDDNLGKKFSIVKIIKTQSDK